MKWPRPLRFRFRALFRKARLDAEMEEEMRLHIEMQTEANIQAGMDPEGARYAALRQFGGKARIQETCHDQRGMRWLTHLLQDARFGVRMLAQTPGFTAVVVLSLALGIGANTAIFTLLDQILLRLLPVKNPGELVLLTWRGVFHGSSRRSDSLPYPLYADLRDLNQVFSGMFCRFRLPLSMSHNGQTERVVGELVSGSYFDVLGVSALLGRTLTAADDRTPGGHPVAVLSYASWKDRFGRDPSIIGQTIRLNGYPMTVVGVSAPGFDGIELGYSPGVRVPMMMKAQMTPGWDDLTNRHSKWANVYGRLKAGVSATQAKASLQPLFRSILAMELQDREVSRAPAYWRAEFRKATIDVLPGSQGRSELRQQAAAPLLVLTALVGVVLLIACANVASLLVARAASRQKEIAVRLALGAGRARLVRQLLVESALLAVSGGALGVLLAVSAVPLLLGFLPPTVSPLSISAAPDVRTLGFTLGVSLAAGLLFGLAPALQATRPDVARALKDQVGAVLGGQVRFRRLLVVGQVALSLLLLTGAGLFVRSLRNLRALDPGFRTENLLAFTVDPTLSGCPAERSRLFYRQLLERVNGTPGVRAAALTVMPLLDSGEWDSVVTVEGYAAKPGENMSPFWHVISPGYFSTLGVPLVAGREFAEKDDRAGPKVAIVNQKFARHYFGAANALGRRIGQGGGRGTRTDIEIIGVVKDTKYSSMRGEIPRQVFFPYQQMSLITEMTLYARTALEPKQMFAALRQQVHSVDANLPVFHMKTMEMQVDQSLASERVLASLSAVFGALATLLAVIGLYGVMAYTVARRAPEIGIRMALGASSSAVLWLVLREACLVAGVGVAAGLPAAWGLARLVRSQLYGIAPDDPVTMAAAAVGLGAIALLAGYVPARRATRTDPLRVLRYE